MRFIHTADVHWGMVPDADQPWGRDRANDIKAAFRRIIEKCRELNADCLLIAGDLFHRPPMNRDLQEMNYLFGTIPSTHVVIVSGQHDRIEPNAALLSFNWSPNVTWFLGPSPDTVYFEDINTEICGISCTARPAPETLTEVPAPETDGHIHILLAHAELPPETLSALGYDYAALGHSHQPLELLDRRAVYPGTPEPLGPDETGAHGVYVGDLHPITHRLQRLDFLRLSEVGYIPLQIAVTERTSASELQDLVSSEIEKRGTKNIYRLRITGQHDPEVHFDLSPLRARFRIVEIENTAEPQYDFAALYREHPSDMIGFYIRRLLRENPSDMSEIEKKALYYGIHALLEAQKGGRG